VIGDYEAALAAGYDVGSVCRNPILRYILECEAADLLSKGLAMDVEAQYKQLAAAYAGLANLSTAADADAYLDGVADGHEQGDCLGRGIVRPAL
jgi:hypothetical protein